MLQYLIKYQNNQEIDMMLTHEIIVNAALRAAREFPLTKMSYFGSYADGKATEESDLDVLVEFTKPAVSILTIIRLKHFLEEELKKSVDVIHAPIPDGAVIEIEKTVDVL
jgi:predicted nucleotidyltransferase